MGVFGRSPNEGRSAREMYGKKPVGKIVKDQCRDSDKQQRGKKK